MQLETFRQRALHQHEVPRFGNVREVRGGLGEKIALAQKFGEAFGLARDDNDARVFVAPLEQLVQHFAELTAVARARRKGQRHGFARRRVIEQQAFAPQ